MEWLPIESAPKDETWVLIRGGKPDMHHDENHIPPCVVAKWVPEYPIQPDKHGWWVFCSYDNSYYGEWEEPTEWMPLPLT